MLSILYLEDNRMDARLIQHVIRENGLQASFRLEASRSGFLMALKEEVFDLVLADFHLPDINALEAIQIIKEEGIDVPILMVSGVISGESAVEIVKAGASDYILKDHLPRLVPAIKRALETHQREKRLKAHEEEIKKIHTILKQAESLGSLGSFEWDFVQNKLILTSGLNLILGLEEADSQPQLEEVLQFIHPADLHSLSSKVDAVIHPPLGESFQFTEDFRIISFHGNQKYVNSRGEIFYDAAGSPNRMVGVIQDISLQKEAEDAIIKLNEGLEQKVFERTEELTKSEAKYRLISDNITDLIVSLGGDGRFEFVSRSIKTILGYGQEELLGSLGQDLVHPDDLQPLSELFGNEVAKGNDQMRVELRLRHKGGYYVWNEAIIKVNPSIGNESYRVQASCRDITQRRKMQEEKEAAMKKEKKLTEMQAQFVSIASHQFRTPLSIIRSNVELLEMMLENGKLPEKRKKFNKICERLNGEVDHLTSLMDDILEMGRIEEGKISPDLEEVDLEKLLVAILENEGKSLDGTRKAIFEVNGEARKLLLDSRLVSHVLINLLSNAFKYSSQAPPPEVSLNFDDKETKISVRDFGIGIPEVEQDRLFESWFRASNTNGVRGTGLGLGISRRFIEAMGGSISFKSKEGEGSTFFISFPQIT